MHAAFYVSTEVFPILQPLEVCSCELFLSCSMASRVQRDGIDARLQGKVFVLRPLLITHRREAS